MARLSIIAAILASATSVLGLSEPGYYANLTWEKPRTLSNWSNLTVETPSGTFIGLLNDTYPNVRQFLCVQYAQPPTGDLRWLPAQKPLSSKKRIDSTFYGPACPQYVSSTSTMWSEYEPTNLLINLGESLDQGSTAWSTTEDCLSLAVWTPAFANKNSKLPVALFVTGGGGVTGGIDVPSQMPPQWISRSQEHIVITINYRVNIFGNPKSRALNETSLSLLDVRAATEWVYENIELFGGDPENIMLWGQSQGAALTHLYTLAFPDEPLASHFGVISQPPSVTLDVSETDDLYEDFDIVAKALGCNYGDDAEAELNLIISPMKDTFFSNESKRYLEGKVAKGPAVRSDTERESASTNLTSTAEAEVEWDCVAALDTTRRYALGLDTYRYYWAGNFTNISPVSWLGAFHWSDLLMIFGTYSKQVGPISQLEVDTSITMQDFILAFLKDPSSVSGLGWPLSDPNTANGGKILEFGKGNAVHNITGNYLDAPCRNSSISGRIYG
ncbi:alpha/beta-hydrolase [Penicillium herquei]|nr:alpha/beta-hydrolase [Penicillium herquei]